MKTKAYSLVQTLIPVCLLIIALSLIITSCVSYITEQTFVTKLRIVYEYLTRAYITTSDEYGNPTNWGISDLDEVEGGKIILLALSHGMPDLDVCSSSYCSDIDIKYKNMNKKAPYYKSFVRYKKDYARAVIGKEAILFASSKNSDCELIYGTSQPLKSICAEIIVDINGAQNPNIFGVDTFVFYLTEYGIIPAGIKEDIANSFTGECSRQGTQGFGCAAWVLMNRNMDYLHCDSLNWNNTKCAG